MSVEELPARRRSGPPHPLESDRECLSAAVDLMRSSPWQTHSVRDLAKAVGMSRSNFARSFRSRFGRSPIEFLRGCRLDRAADLLRNGSTPIKRIGALVGYDSRTSFASAFRRAFGISPLDYRASHLKMKCNDIHNVSARLRAQRGLTQDLAWEVDLNTGRVWWSEGTFLALGYGGRSRLVMDVARFYARVHPADRERVVAGASSACVDGSLAWQDNFRFQKADETFVEISNACLILRNAEGAASHLLGVMRLST